MILVFAFNTPDDKAKFDALYQRYSRLMLYKAHEILRDPMLAEDAVSEAFIRVYKNLHKIGDPAAPSAAAFVTTIAKNAALTLWRKRRGAAAEELDEHRAAPGDLEGEVLSSLMTEEIYALLGQLSEASRNIFLLKYAYDLSHREIADMMHMSENTVNVRLHRAREALRKAGMIREVGL